MTPLHEALMWAGITPPATNSRKTTCPMCSNTRAKREQRCLSIYPAAHLVAWFCHHCQWEGAEPISNSSTMAECGPAQPGNCPAGAYAPSVLPSKQPWRSDRLHGHEAAA